MYLFIGYVGGFELWSEDCTKKFYQQDSDDKGKKEINLMETAFTASDSQSVSGGDDMIAVGTSTGQILVLSISNDSVVFHDDKTMNLSQDSPDAILSLAVQGNQLAAGTATG